MKSTNLLRFVWFGLTALALGSLMKAEDSAAPAQKPDPWQPLRRIVGSWEGVSHGKSGSGQVQREYKFVLRDRFLEVANTSVYPAQEDNPQGERHEDRGFFSYDRGQKKIVLRQFHVEGFVNHYVLESVSGDGNTIVFVTTAIENIPSGWRARETYVFGSDDAFTEKFELAEPESDFELYSETRFTRKR